MRRIFKVSGFLLFAAMLLGACGNFGKNADEPNRDEATLIHEDEKEGGSLDTGDGYGFDMFKLEIDVDGQDTIEAEYKMEREMEAEYKNKLAGVDLEEDEAMVKLDEMFIDIMFTKDTSEKDAIDKLMQWFGLDTYTKFDLEVHFDDGSKLDFENKK